MWTAPLFLDRLKTALLADAALMALANPTPRVFTHLADERDRSDTIMFWRVAGDQEIVAMGQAAASSRDDDYTISSTIEVQRSLEQGSDHEAIAKLARDRAMDMMNRVVAVCLVRPGSSPVLAANAQTHKCVVARIDLLQGPAEASEASVMVAIVDFDIEVTVRVTGI